MDVGKVFGERLLRLREERNETQEQLANAVDITRQSLSRYETNERTPNIELIYNIAKHYNVSAEYLLGLSDVQSLDNMVQAASEAAGLNGAAMDKMNEHIKPKPNRCKLAEAVQVIRTVTLVGSGTQEDPCRDVVQYWTLDGQLIAMVDPNNSLKEEPLCRN